MIKSIQNFLIIFFIFQQLKSQISQIDQNRYNAFCDETLHVYNDKIVFHKMYCQSENSMNSQYLIIMLSKFPSILWFPHTCTLSVKRNLSLLLIGRRSLKSTLSKLIIF